MFLNCPPAKTFNTLRLSRRCERAMILYNLLSRDSGDLQQHVFVFKLMWGEGNIAVFRFWFSHVHRDFEDAAFSDSKLTAAAKLSWLLHCFIYFDTSVLICTVLSECTWSKSHVKVLTNLSQNVLITPSLLSTTVRSFADELMGQRSSPFCSLATPFKRWTLWWTSVRTHSSKSSLCFPSL